MSSYRSFWSDTDMERDALLRQEVMFDIITRARRRRPPRSGYAEPTLGEVAKLVVRGCWRSLVEKLIRLHPFDVICIRAALCVRRRVQLHLAWEYA